MKHSVPIEQMIRNNNLKITYSDLILPAFNYESDLSSVANIRSLNLIFVDLARQPFD